MTFRMRKNDISYSRDYLRPSKRRRKREAFDWRGLLNISRNYGVPCGYTKITWDFRQGIRTSCMNTEDSENSHFHEYVFNLVFVIL